MFRGAIVALATVAVAAALAVVAGTPAYASEYQNTHWCGACSPAYSQTEWIDNTGNWYIRGVVRCQSGRNYIIETGGFVQPDNKYSRATCPAGYPNMQGAGYDVKQTAGGAITRKWLIGGP